MDSKKIIEDQISTYKKNFIENKSSSLGTFQNDRVTQHLRFERIVKPFKGILSDEVSLHDFGCGSCDLHEYLNQQNLPHEYSGTEIVQEMVDYARLRFPKVKISNQDVFEQPYENKFDIVVFSGGLYLPGNISKNEWGEFVNKIILKMFEMCKIGISFNLLSTYCTYQNDDLYYLDPKEAFDFCNKELSRFVILDQAYPLYEWTITVFKKEYILESYPEKELSKYLK